MSRKLTTEEFIEKARKVHGDKYGYEKVVYVNSKKEVIITCPIHEDFLKTPNEHLNGGGCKKCSLGEKNRKQIIPNEEFIERAKKVHNNKYTYEKVDYKNSKVEIIITCPKHGYFKQTPNSHLMGCGCPSCGNEKNAKNSTLTKEEFIEKSNKIHNNKYSYEKTNYIKSKIPVIITCPIHGDFEQAPRAHLSGVGCKKCSIENGHYPKLSSTEEFIQKAKKVHNNFYSYEKVNYVNSKTNVIITCPEHGDFEQAPNSHLRNHGCPECAKSHMGKKHMSTEEFIIRANEIHKGKYTYEKTVFKDIKTKVTITCPIHGEFKQSPNSHLSGKGHGCWKCANEETAKGNKITKETFIKRAKELHGNLYDYSNIDYKNTKTPIRIKCNTCNSFFYQTPNQHMKAGCPYCLNKTESLIRKIFEFYLDCEFPISRPDFLKTNLTKGGLTLDGYNENLSLAFEYQGEQHYGLLKNIRQDSKEELKKRQLYDKIKKDLCEKNRVSLLIIPYWDINGKDTKEILLYIKDLLSLKGYTIVKDINSFVETPSNRLEEIQKIFKEHNVSLLEEFPVYRGMSYRYTIKCNSCGYERKVTVSKLLTQKYCKKCENKLYHKRSKRVLCLETGVIYSSSKEAEKQNNIFTIGQCCRGSIKTAGGLHWEYEKDIN